MTGLSPVLVGAGTLLRIHRLVVRLVDRLALVLVLVVVVVVVVVVVALVRCSLHIHGYDHISTYVEQG